jgi:hypothetical protein
VPRSAKRINFSASNRPASAMNLTRHLRADPKMEALFSKYSLRATLDGQQKKLREHIDKLAEAYLLGASEEDLIAYLKQEFWIEPPVLGKPFIAASKEIEIDVSHDPLRRGPFPNQRVHVKGMQIQIKVPYTGDGNLFRFYASSLSTSPPRALITKDYLEFYIKGEHLVGAEISRNLGTSLAEIKAYLTEIDETCNAYNASLDKKIREILQFRKQRLLKNREIVASIGLPIQSRTDAPPQSPRSQQPVRRSVAIRTGRIGRSRRNVS